MTNLNDYVFIDTETGGFDWREHPLLELSYAVGDGEIITLYPEFESDMFMYCDPEALEVNQFLTRFYGVEQGKWYEIPADPTNRDVPTKVEFGQEGEPHRFAWLDLPTSSTTAQWDAFAQDIKGKYWVGANPRFDVNFVEAFYTPESLGYNHRLFDIQAYAAGKWDAPYPMSFREIINAIRTNLAGYDKAHLLSEPDHTAYMDVKATREAFAYLLDYNVFRLLVEGE